MTTLTSQDFERVERESAKPVVLSDITAEDLATAVVMFMREYRDIGGHRQRCENHIAQHEQNMAELKQAHKNIVQNQERCRKIVLLLGGPDPETVDVQAIVDSNVTPIDSLDGVIPRIVRMGPVKILMDAISAAVSEIAEQQEVPQDETPRARRLQLPDDEAE